MKKSYSLLLLIALQLFSSACKKEFEKTLPIIETLELTDITSSSVSTGGSVKSDGGSYIIEKGVCWSTIENPTIEKNITTEGPGKGTFVTKIIGLNSGIIYYFRAYATNGIGTSYGSQVSLVIPNFKNYLQPSYNLRISDIWIDCYKTPIITNLQMYHAKILADFNYDGYDDILVSYSDYSESRFPLEIFLNDKTNKNFTKSTISIINNIGVKNPRKGIIGDFNNDNKPDVIFAESGLDAAPWSGTEQSILISRQEGYEYRFLMNEIWFGHGVCSGDIDNDGDLDVFFTTPSEKLCLLMNDGKANFTNYPEKIKFSIIGIAVCELHDLNKDGFLDLVVGGHNFLSDPNNSPASVLWGNGIDFDESRSLQIPGVTNWDVILDFNFSDLNNDGIDEIIVNRTQDPNTQYYKGFRIQIVKISHGDSYDITDSIIQDYYSKDIQWIVWLRTEDIDKNGKLDIFDSDKGHYNSGISLRWEQDAVGIFHRIR